MMSNGDGICYVLFSRQNSKEPATHYQQIDVLPLASSDDDKTFVHPPSRPIPTTFDDEDQAEAWELNKATNIWSRGNVTWGPPTFVLRVFNFRAQYKRQIYFGKTWKKFDKMVANFDPNDNGMVRKYNAWLDFVFKLHHTGYGVPVEYFPWTRKERLCLRGWVNEYIRKEGLLAWVNVFEWDREVIGFNLFLRKAGCAGPGRTEVDILRMFGRDEVIFRCFHAAMGVSTRVENGEELTQDELHPVGYIPIREGLEAALVETTAEDHVSLEDTRGGEVDEEDEIEGPERRSV
jgi:hypothetical protein